MTAQKIYIKNMVCPRCIAAVNDIFKEMKVDVISIQLGQVIINCVLDDNQRTLLSKKLELNGFELLQDQKSKLINQIKTIIIDQIHHKNQRLNINFSTLLAEKLHHEYTSISKLFSTIEGITIERFILKQKIEKAKELLFYDELTLTEIAHKMNYSSVAHLSAQFRKETGMTPSEFKKLRKPSHHPLDSI
jgi:AraC-like DNA-binding protein